MVSEYQVEGTRAKISFEIQRSFGGDLEFMKSLYSAMEFFNHLKFPTNMSKAYDKPSGYKGWCRDVDNDSVGDLERKVVITQKESYRPGSGAQLEVSDSYYHVYDCPIDGQSRELTKVGFNRFYLIKNHKEEGPDWILMSQEQYRDIT